MVSITSTLAVVTPANPAAWIGPLGERGLSGLDMESAQWIESLRGQSSEIAVRRLHALLLRVARSEIRRRNTGTTISGPELDDLAHQAASDAALLITNRLDQFRGESRFTTWAYKFVMFEVSTKLGRHFWNHPRSSRDLPDWDRLPERFGRSPVEEAESKELADAVRAAVEKCLTVRQREVFVALIIQEIPLDALTARLGTNRNAVYKLMFDARRKLHQELVAQGYIDPRRQT